METAIQLRTSFLILCCLSKCIQGFKLKLSRKVEFNHLTIILTSPSHVSKNSPLRSRARAQHVKLLTFYMESKVETRINLRTSYSNTRLNYQSFRMLKLLRNDEFNHLNIILTMLTMVNTKYLKKLQEHRIEDLKEFWTHKMDVQGVKPHAQDPIKQSTNQQGFQLIKRSLNILKHTNIPFLPHYPHQACRH